MKFTLNAFCGQVKKEEFIAIVLSFIQTTKLLAIIVFDLFLLVNSVALPKESIYYVLTFASHVR